MKRALAFLGVGVLVALLVLGICYPIFGRGLGRSDTTASYRFTGSWEAPGGQPFDQPYAVGVDPRNGDVLATDAQNQRVVVFDPAGKFLRQFGKKGDGNGQFALPSGVAVGPDGSVYVADYMQDRVQKFSEMGEFVLAWGSSGSSENQFRSPGGVAVDANGQVYVADIFNHRISVFDSQAKVIRTIGHHGKWRLGQFDYPADVDLAQDGQLLVADTYNHRIQLFAAEGEPLAGWGWYLFWLWPRPSEGSKGFGETTGAAFGRGSGLIHVADAKNRRVVMLDEHGRFVSEFRVPESAGKAQTPIQVAVSADGRTVYATDIANNRILVLAVQGKSR